MYTRIIVPLDGSKLAEQVLPYVRFLGNGLSAQIELLRIIDPSFTYMADFAHGVNTERANVPGSSHAQDYLAEVAASLRDSGLTVSSTVVSEYGEGPASEIVNTGSRDRATVIAMASHGRSGLARLALGSITDNGPLEDAFDWAVVRGAIIGIAVGIILPLVEKWRNSSRPIP